MPAARAGRPAPPWQAATSRAGTCLYSRRMNRPIHRSVRSVTPCGAERSAAGVGRRRRTRDPKDRRLIWVKARPRRAGPHRTARRSALGCQLPDRGRPERSRAHGDDRPQRLANDETHLRPPVPGQQRDDRREARRLPRVWQPEASGFTATVTDKRPQERRKPRISGAFVSTATGIRRPLPVAL